MIVYCWRDERPLLLRLLHPLDESQVMESIKKSVDLENESGKTRPLVVPEGVVVFSVDLSHSGVLS